MALVSEAASLCIKRVCILKTQKKLMILQILSIYLMLLPSQSKRVFKKMLAITDRYYFYLYLLHIQ